MLTEYEVEGKTTMVAPLSGFYVTPSTGMSEIRIAYVLEREQLRDAVAILTSGLKTYIERRNK
jgi:aspartate aminotransferase